MKVVYFSSARIPSKTANGIHIMKMCNAFAQLGCDVTLYAYVDNNYTVEGIFSYYDTKHKFKIQQLTPGTIIPSSVKNGVIMALHAFRDEPDLIIGRDLKACYFSSFLRRRTYFEIHAPVVESGKVNNFLFNRIIKKKAFQKLILITQSLNKYYQNQYKQLKGKTLVIPDGADKVDLSEIVPVGVRREDRVNLGYTGHLYPGKGMEIISQLVPKCPFAHFHVVGGKDDDLIKWKYLSQYGNITFYGHINHSAIKNYISEFDILLLPNQHRVGSNAGRDIGKWTSPLKLFEYMAFGKPIICSDIEVLREIIQGDRNGILCDPAKIEEWVEAVKRLRESPDFAKQIGKVAKEDLESQYTWERRAKRIILDSEKYYGE